MAPKLAAICVLVCIGLESGGRAPASDTQPAQTLESGEFTVELNGMKLWYKVSGTGPVCLMPTPAWGISSDFYFRSLGAMEKMFTVVYLDSRGTGRSGRAAAATEYTWAHLVGDLEALRVHLQQDKVWLMGHSEGGMQVLHYACKYPERVSGLVVIDATAAWGAAQRADVAERAARRAGQPWYDEALKAMSEEPKTDEELAAHLKAIMPFYWSDAKKAEPFDALLAATSFSAHAYAGQSESGRLPFDLTDELKNVTAPALVVVGDDDFICSPEAATEMHMVLPNSKLLVIEKCGHMPWLEQPEIFEARVTQFLAALGLPAK